MKKYWYFFLSILISCSSSKVMTDYDNTVNFSDFKTFNFYEDVGEGLSELDVKRVTKAITFEMTERNIIEAENPDMFINVIVKTTEAQNNNTIGIGIGNGGRNGGFGISGGIPIGSKKLNEEFIIEFVNAKTDEVFWEGRLNSTLKKENTPEVKELHYKNVVNKILTKYPVNKKSSN